MSGMLDWRVRRVLVVAVEENDGLSTIDIAERSVVVLLRLPYSSGVVPVSCRGI